MLSMADSSKSDLLTHKFFGAILYLCTKIKITITISMSIAFQWPSGDASVKEPDC